ncbi:MAG: outer membrane beta-barrel protein [Pseudomonadota bacterium]
MKKTVIAASLAAAGLLTAASAQAQEGYYFGADVSAIQVTQPSPTDDLNMAVAGFTGGYYFTDWMALEAGMQFDVSADEVNGTRVEVNRLLDFALRFEWDLENGIRPYASLGGANIGYSAAGTRSDDSSVQFGFGARYDLGEDYFWVTEINQVSDEDDAEAYQLGLGIRHLF